MLSATYDFCTFHPVDLCRLQQHDERSCLLVNFHVMPDAQKALHPKLTQDFLDARQAEDGMCCLVGLVFVMKLDVAIRIKKKLGNK